MGIGKSLSDILKEKNSNPNELAESIGVSPSTIYSIIKRDNMKVDITVLAKICKALGVSMERFYEDYRYDIKSDLSLSSHERDLILAYRQQPSMQEAVDRLLGIAAADESQNKKRA